MNTHMIESKQDINILEQKFGDIAELYALNEELMETVENAVDPEAQLELVEALIETIGESTDVLTDEYVTLCEGKPGIKQTAKGRIEAALRKVYVAVHDVEKRAAETKNAALAVVKKIRRQLEVVVSHFVDFMTLSLDRVMQKNDVEELRQRHANIALMLHNIGQGA